MLHKKAAIGRLGALICLLCLVLTPSIHAMKIHSAVYSVQKGEVVDDDLYFSGGSLTIHGSVKGDVIGFGDHLTVDGSVGGDILFIARRVEITGRCDGDVRIASEDFLCGAQIERNLFLLADESHFTDNLNLGRNIVFLGNYLELRGKIAGSVSGTIRTIRFRGSVERDVRLGQVDSLQVENESIIRGRLSYKSPIPGIFHSNTPAQQGVEWTKIREFRGISPITARHFKRIWLLISFIFSSVTGTVLIALLPGPIRRCTLTNPGDIVSRLFIGLAFIILVPLATVALAISIIGLPVSFLVLGAYILVLNISWILASLAFGRMIATRTSLSNLHDILTFIFGNLVCSLTVSLPLIGMLARLAILSFGTGLIVSKVKRRI